MRKEASWVRQLGKMGIENAQGRGGEICRRMVRGERREWGGGGVIEGCCLTIKCVHMTVPIFLIRALFLEKSSLLLFVFALR